MGRTLNSRTQTISMEVELERRAATAHWDHLRKSVTLNSKHGCWDDIVQ